MYPLDSQIKNAMTHLFRSCLLILTTLFCLTAHVAMAREVTQDFGLSINAGIQKKIVQGLSVALDGEIRTNNNTTDLERLALAASMAYKPIPYFKAEVGYEFIGRYYPKKTSTPNVVTDTYWVPRHRVQVAASGILPIGAFTLSLRERYQYTHSSRSTASQWEAVTGLPLEDKVAEASDEHVLRSRLKAEYEISDVGVTPYLSIEFYDDLAHSFELTDIKTTVGAVYDVTPNHALEFYYRYAAEVGSDAKKDTHLLAVGYQFSF